MSKKIEAIDINTMPEKEKARLYKILNDSIKNEKYTYEQLEQYFEERYPGLIQERIQKNCYGKPSTVDDSDEIDISELMNNDWVPTTKEEWEQYNREEQEWDDEERKNYLLYDPGSGEKILYPDCIKKYGRLLTDKMFIADNKNSGTVEKETWQQIQDIHKKNKGQTAKAKPCADVVTVTEPQIVIPNIVVEGKAFVQKQREAGDDYFLKIERGVIRNESYKQLFRQAGRSVLYEHLWANIARAGWIDTPGYPIKKQYYDNGFLAHCTSLRKLGQKCGLDKNTVKNSLDEFNEVGIIKLEHIIPQGKTYGQTVAILGEWRSIEQGGTFTISERYYRDEVFLAPAPDVPFQFKK